MAKKFKFPPWQNPSSWNITANSGINYKPSIDDQKCTEHWMGRVAVAISAPMCRGLCFSSPEESGFFAFSLHFTTYSTISTVAYLLILYCSSRFSCTASWKYASKHKTCISQMDRGTSANENACLHTVVCILKKPSQYYCLYVWSNSLLYSK